MKIRSHQLLRVEHEVVVNGELLESRSFSGVSTDSRTVKPGDLFVAIRGERFDGHAYVSAALAKGAAAAIVESSFMAQAPAGVPFLVVRDSVRALGQLARIYRDGFSLPVVAVAGSNGKTTTKEMIAAVLSGKFSVLRTEGNLNNQIGVPLTLFQLETHHRIAVIELGTNHPGELAALCEIARPTHGILTNIGSEHLEFFGSLEGVEREEGTLFECLAAHAGTVAFVNADDPRVKSAAQKVKHRVTFGFGSGRLNFRGKRLRVDEQGCSVFQFSGGRVTRPKEVALRIPGEHNTANALAAATVGMTFGVPAAKIVEALGNFASADKRMQVLHIQGVLVLNDAYNANPDSTLAALRTLGAMRVSGKKIAVLADMRELGEAGPAEHARVGREASGAGVDYLLTYGELGRLIHDASKVPFSVHYDNKNILAEYLAELLSPGDVLLVKGSRSMKMEDIITFLQERLH